VISAGVEVACHHLWLIDFTQRGLWSGHCHRQRVYDSAARGLTRSLPCMDKDTVAARGSSHFYLWIRPPPCLRDLLEQLPTEVRTGTATGSSHRPRRL